MINITRRNTGRLLALAPVGALAMTGLALPAAARTFAGTSTDLAVPNAYQNFKQGTMQPRSPDNGLVVVWPDLGRVKM